MKERRGYTYYFSRPLTTQTKIVIQYCTIVYNISSSSRPRLSNRYANLLVTRQ